MRIYPESRLQLLGLSEVTMSGGVNQRQNQESKTKGQEMNKRYRVLSRLASGSVNRLHWDVVDTENQWDVLVTYRQKKKAVELVRELNSTSGWHRVIS